MAFCGACGKESNAKFCQSCGTASGSIADESRFQTPTAVAPQTSKAILKVELVEELRTFRRFVLLWFALIVPVLFGATFFTIRPGKVEDNLWAIVAFWILYALLGLLAIQPLRWINSGSWKARRRAGWLLAAFGLLTFPSDTVPAAIRGLWFVGSIVFYYFTLNRTLNSDAVKALCDDFQNVPSRKKRVPTIEIAEATVA